MTKINLQFRTITQRTFELNVDDNVNIAQVKAMVAQELGQNEYPVDGQRLILNGKVLQDNQRISELQITPPRFIVVMSFRKPGIQENAKSGQSSSGGSENTDKKDTPAKETVEKNKPAEATVEKPPVSGTASPTPTAEVTPEHAQTVADIEAMGYPRAEVIAALRAAFFNAERAVEYLIGGIPEGTQQDQAESTGGEEENMDLGFLAESPQFQQIREMVRANPTVLPQIIQQIGETNPQLLEAIRNNQERFIELLNSGGGVAQPIGQGGAVGGGAQGQAGANAPQQVAIPVTEEDRAAINRLLAMGFPEPLVIEAFIACDRNEELAVNYILQRMQEPDNE